ncbi:MAG: thioesterase family protein [Burkholderiales bacterium]|nr:thioesterase family protein [Burkholderiales bacterium]
MDSNSALRNGLTGHAELIVGDAQTAPHVGSGAVPVLATPVLVNLLEAAALDAAERYVPAGQQTVGIRLDIRHFAATPIGMKVRAQAEVINVDGRMIAFRVWAEDDVELIADGTHDRVIITLAKFDARMRAKAEKGQPSIKP